MPYTVDEDRWSEQPIGEVEVNREVGDRVSLLVLPGQTQGDVVSGVLGTVQRSTRVHTSQGPALRRPAAPNPADGYYFTGAKPILSAPYTIVVLAKSAAEAKRSAWFFLGDENASPFPQIAFGPNTSRGAAASSGTMGFFEYSGAFQSSADATAQIDGEWHVFAVVRPAGAVAPRLYRDGKQLTLAGSTTNASIPATSAFAPYIGGSNYTTADRCPEGDIAGVAVYRGELPEIPGTPQAFWATFLAPHTRRVYFTTGGATTLQGAAAAQASASAALTTQIPLAGVAVSVATASGSITTAIPLAATAASVSTAAGALTTSIALSGAALAQALAAAGMDTSILLAASAQGQASATGDLAGAAQLAANAQASAGAAASLTIQIRLAGDALAQAFASGDLTTGGAGALAADAQAFASASGALLTAIPLLGAALSTASASGNIITMIPLQGAAAVVASGVGSLTASITLGAQAAAQALASGALTATIRLDAAAVAEAAASGALGSESAAATPLARILRIAREDRALRVAKEDRTLRISA